MIDFKALGREMKRLRFSRLAPGETVRFPASVEDGDGVFALLELLYGTAGYAQTGRRMGIEDDISIVYFLRLLLESAKNLGIESQLEQTYAALSAALTNAI